MNKVLIVDDHKSMCDALTFALEGSDDFEVVGKLASAAQADIYCERLHPDLVFMDVCTFGGASGLDATIIVRQKYPDIKIVVMSGFDEFVFATGAEEAGAHAFVPKSSSLVRFVEVARGVMQGKTYWSEGKADLSHNSGGEVPLTEAEMEVLQLMCRHKTGAEIAQELEIDEETVKRHISNMLAETGFDKAVDLIFHAHIKGWIQHKN